MDILLAIQEIFNLINTLRGAFVGETIYLLDQYNLINLDDLELLAFYLSALWWWLIGTIFIGFYLILSKLFSDMKILFLITFKSIFKSKKKTKKME